MMIYLIGFGFGLAKVLEDMGFTVFAGCLLGDSDGAQTLRSSTTGRMHVIQLDVTKDTSVEDALKFVKKTISETKCGKLKKDGPHINKMW
jgi:3-hydroxybutyrate dehydrogenase